MGNNDNRRSNDPYEEEYRRQLERYSRMAGDDGGEADLSFGSAEDAFYDDSPIDTPYRMQGNITSRNYSEHPMRNNSRQRYPSQQYAYAGEGYADMQGQRTSGYADDGYREAPRQRTSGYADDGYRQPRRRPAPQRAAHDERRSTQGRRQRPQSSGGRRPAAKASAARTAEPRTYNQRPAPQPQTHDTRRKKSAEKKSAPRRQTRYNSEELQFGGNRGGKGMEKEQRHPVRRFFRTLILLLLVIFIGLNGLLYYYTGLVNVRERRDRTVTNGSLSSKSVTNILLIGSDTRDENEYGRTDTMILLSVNKSNKTVTMTSFMRDMYVNIKGNDNNGNAIDFWDKLNAAYVYGGAELLMDTIEYNFDISVDDYVYVDFFAFIDIVDAVGGIELEISDEEAAGMEDPMREQNKYLGQAGSTDLLEHGGKMTVNGNQALGYARLRYVGNADFQRTERQREVISKLIEKVKSSDPLTMNRFARAVCSKLATNMSRPQMMMMTYKAIFSMKYEIKSLRLPEEGDYSYGIHGDQSTLDVDIEACRALLQKEIYSNS